MMSVKQCTKESSGVATNFLYHYIFVPHTHEWQLKLRSGSDTVNILNSGGCKEVVVFAHMFWKVPWRTCHSCRPWAS